MYSVYITEVTFRMKVDQRIRYKVYRRDNYTCQYCGVLLDDNRNALFRGKVYDITIDHIIPRWSGGANEEDNLVTACVKCNYEKGNRLN